MVTYWASLIFALFLLRAHASVPASYPSFWYWRPQGCLSSTQSVISCCLGLVSVASLRHAFLLSWCAMNLKCGMISDFSQWSKWVTIEIIEVCPYNQVFLWIDSPGSIFLVIQWPPSCPSSWPSYIHWGWSTCSGLESSSTGQSASTSIVLPDISISAIFANKSTSAIPSNTTTSTSTTVTR